MAAIVEQAIENSRRLDQELLIHLEQNAPSFVQLYNILDRIRTECTTAVLRDVATASIRKVDERLWEAHQKVNTNFRTTIRQLQDVGKSRLVERRKLGTEYTKFLKSSQRFYREFIGNLAINYKGIPELERVAGKLRPRDSAALSETSKDIPKISAQVLDTCHKTLIHLGDLSRYRATEISSKEPDWSHAVGYYDLARAIHPASGTSDNQLAVIAREQGNLFRATYHLYRAISVEDPHPGAEGNLRKVFYKVSQVWNKDEHTTDPTKHAPNLLSALHLQLVCTCYHGKHFKEHENLENKVFEELLVFLKTPQQDSTFYKIVIINLAAGHLAQQRFEKDPTSNESLQAYVYFLRVNIRTMTCLLITIRGDLREQPKVAASDKALKSHITPVMQNILPKLRLYSAWLRKNIKLMINPVHNVVDSVQPAFWSAFADFQSAIAIAFPAESLVEVDHLLQEDVDSIAFQPLMCDETRDMWFKGDMKKPHVEEMPELADSTHLEMLSRIRSLLVVGLKLSLEKNVPVDFIEKEYRFAYRFETYQTPHSKSLSQVQEFHPGQIGPTIARRKPIESPPEEQDLEAEKMVSDLVGTNIGPSLDSNMSIEVLLEQNEQRTQDKSMIDSGHISSFPVGTDTANDLLTAVQNYSASRRGSNTQSHSFSPRILARSTSNNSSSPNTAPSNPNKPSVATVIMSRNGSNSSSKPPLMEGPLTPSMGHRSPSQSGSYSRPGTAGAAKSPGILEIPGNGHSRINSDESASSKNSIWSQSGIAWGSSLATNAVVPASPSSGRLGNGTFGTLERVPASRPILFGSGNSPWSMTENESRVYGVAESPRLSYAGSPRIGSSSLRMNANQLT